MISEIKKQISNLRGKKIRIVVDVGRNKKESYEGRILGVYQNVWTFETISDVKSFGYNDILINNVVIDI